MNKATRIFYWITRILALSIVIICGIGLIIETGADHSQKADLLFIGFNAMCLFLVSFLPNLFYAKKLMVPNILCDVYLVFIICSLLLGEIFDFYNKIAIWDTLLHFSSPSILGILGFSIINLINNNGKTTTKLSPLFVALFVFAFAITIGVLWELIEFSMDTFTGSNMQRYISPEGIEFVGQAALKDTMKDLILDTLGSLIVAVVCYADLKSNKLLLHNLEITKMNNTFKTKTKIKRSSLNKKENNKPNINENTLKK